MHDIESVIDDLRMIAKASPSLAGGAPGAALEREPSAGAGRWADFFRRHYLCEDGCQAQARRYLRLLEGFRASFGRREVSFARAPGRVNIIGEHTDYNAGPVLPAAIHRDIVAVFTPRQDGIIRVRDLQEAYGERQFRISSAIAPFAQGDWGNYVKAAVQRLVQYCGSDGPNRREELRGFDAVVHSTVPPAAGLSSSSAFVVLSATLFRAVNDITLEPPALAELMAEAEYYVGTRGGGMDQTVSVMGEDDAALFIDFADSSVSSVPLSKEHIFVVAHSLVNAAKSDAARASYNLRAAESRMAGALFKRVLESELQREVEPRLIGRLRHVREEIGAERFDGLARATFHERPYSREEIVALLGLSVEQLEEQFYLAAPSVGASPEGYKLYQRFTHVLEESLRVERLAAALQAGEIERVGALMNESHRSCRDLYEISCPELDELVEIEREAGAIGARMTGAGFGGCTVYLVAREKSRKSIAAVIDGYYRRLRGVRQNDYSALVFPVRAVRGAHAL